VISGITKWDPFWGDPNMMQIYSCCCCLPFLVDTQIPFFLADLLIQMFPKVVSDSPKGLVVWPQFFGCFPWHQAPGPEKILMILNAHAPNVGHRGIGPKRVGHVELVIEKMNGDLMVAFFWVVATHIFFIFTPTWGNDPI